jgi:5,10-methylenetetrahydromethanopterin reductase
MKISWFDSANEVSTAVENADRARQLGLYRYWAPQIMNTDPMVVLGIVAREVPEIRLGTSVVAMQTTFAQNLAAQARTINQVADGRFTLGLGTNHEPIMTGAYGQPWTKPYSHMVEYLDALLPLLSEQKVSVSGEFVTHHCEINVPGPAPDVVLAALGPRMLRLARERTSGTLTWMTGPRAIAEHVRPEIGDQAEVIAGVPVFVTDDQDKARRVANVQLAIYGQLPSYRAMLDREGMNEPADMVLMGSPEEILGQLDAYRSAGCSEVAFNVLGRGDAVEGAWELARLTGGSH